MWGDELRNLSWIPVLVTVPRGVTSFLPWPERIHITALATPSQCVHLRDIWTCSSTHRICSVDVKDELVHMLLGWDRPVYGRIAALQLLNMKETLEKCNDTSNSAHRISLTEAYYQIIPRVFEALTTALGRESTREGNTYSVILLLSLYLCPL